MSMDVEIGELTSTVRAVDGQTILSPHVLRRVVDATLRAARERAEHEQRIEAERRVTAGVAEEHDQGY